MLRTVLRYTIPMLVLGAVAGGFLSRRSFRPLNRKTQLAVAGVAALPLVASGTLHLVHPSAFVPLLPPWVPQRALVIALTGLPELAGAAGLFFQRTRRPAAAWLAVFMIAIFPANVHVAGQRVQGLAMPEVPLRTAMQAGYMLLLLVAGYGLPGTRPGLARSVEEQA